MCDCNRATSQLSDEEVARHYLDKRCSKCLWFVVAKYYDELKGPFFKKWRGLKPEDRVELYYDTWKEFLTRDILGKWARDGLSVKNWVYCNILAWLPSKTKVYRQGIAERQFVSLPEDGEKEVIASNNPQRSPEYQALEQAAAQYLRSLLKRGRDVLTPAQLEVLRLLWANYYAAGPIRPEQALAAELGIAKDVFSHRKERAMAALCDRLMREGKLDHIPFLHLFFGYDLEKLERLVAGKIRAARQS